MEDRVRGKKEVKAARSEALRHAEAVQERAADVESAHEQEARFTRRLARVRRRENVRKRQDANSTRGDEEGHSEEAPICCAKALNERDGDTGAVGDRGQSSVRRPNPRRRAGKCIRYEGDEGSPGEDGDAGVV